MNPTEAHANFVATGLNGQRHHEFAALQCGIWDDKPVPEVRNPGSSRRQTYWCSRALCSSWLASASPCTARCTTLPPWETCRCSTSRGETLRRHILIHAMKLGLAFNHSLARIFWCMYSTVSPCWLRTATRAGRSVINLLYCCRVLRKCGDS